MPDALPPDLARALERSADRRGPIGTRVIYFTEVTSTNDEAARLAEAGAPEGTTVIASSQTAGRGRFGRPWFSPPGAGLYVSVVIRDRTAAPFLTIAGGVAIADGIAAASGLPVAIKWPNDIVIAAGKARRKLAGILAEASTAVDGLQHVILGFGVNVAAAAYPPEIADRASSLEGELGREVDAGRLLAECLAALAARMNELRTGEARPTLHRWIELSPSAFGARVEWDGPSGIQSGVTSGIAADGALLVRTPAGIVAIRSGSVAWV